MFESFFGDMLGTGSSSIISFLSDPVLGPGVAFIGTFVLFFIVGYAISWYRNYWKRRSELKTLDRWRVH